MTSQNVPVTVHPAREGDMRSDVYIPNGKHRRCSFTPQKQLHTNKECSNDTRGDHTLPASQHIGENPADGGPLEHLDLPADAKVKYGRQGSECILLRFQHKIHRLSMAGELRSRVKGPGLPADVAKLRLQYTILQ